VDEAVTNVIVHAYNNEAEHEVAIELRFMPQALEVHICHHGRAIRENEVVLPDPREYVKHPRKGGLGLLLMSRFMDEIRYIETGEGSECLMIKRVV
jgi:anti-sigma regulatory factor (Ser/Thr protein kinase)